MDYLLTSTFEVEKVIRELGIMSFEPFKDLTMLMDVKFVMKHIP
jgi:hypothetical protein